MTAAAPVRKRAAVPSRRAARQAPVRTAPPADRRRHLQVVDDRRVAIARRQRRARVLALVGGAIIIVSLFALAAFHAMLASGQAQLDHLGARVSDAQARYESLRLDVAELEAPSRIVREAQTRLGMVPPPDVTYLSPSGAVVAEVGQTAASDPATSPDDAGNGAAWSTVKPYLTGRP